MLTVITINLYTCKLYTYKYALCYYYKDILWIGSHSRSMMGRNMVITSTHWEYTHMMRSERAGGHRGSGRRSDGVSGWSIRVIFHVCVLQLSTSYSDILP